MRLNWIQPMGDVKEIVVCMSLEFREGFRKEV